MDTKGLPPQFYRWMIILVLIASWSMATAFQLRSIYEPRTIEMTLNGIFPADKLITLLRDAGVKEMTLQYQKPFGDGFLIMTTGGEARLKKVDLTAGSLLTPGENRRAVIGDQVARAHFGSDQVLDRRLPVGGETYRVTGVVNRSKDVVISYHPELLDEGWHQQTLWFLPPEGSRPEIRIRDVERSLALNGVSWRRKLQYSQMIHHHQNLALAALLGILFLVGKRCFRRIRGKSREIWNAWKQQRNTTHVTSFLVKHRPLHHLLVFLAVTGMGGWLALSWTFRQFRLPEGFLPDNLLSPASWRMTLDMQSQAWLSLAEEGITGIHLHSLLSNLGLVTMMLLLLGKWVFWPEQKQGGMIPEKPMGKTGER